MRKRTRNASSGFTIIELLAVITIVVLLISITLPALGKSREKARRAVCLSNLHQTHLAFAYYAENFENQVPIGYRSASKQYNSMIYSGTAGQWVLFGLLFRSGFQSTRNVYFCPSQQAEKFLYNTVANPWPASSAPSGNIQAGYASRPEKELPDNPAAPPASCQLPFYPKLDQFQQKAIFSDLTAAANRVRTGHRDGANVLYAGGSARWVPLSNFEQPDAQWPEPALPPAGTFNATQDLIWSAFDGQ